MRVHANSGIAGILVDMGTGKRIPFAIWFDTETGEYEAHAATPNGLDILAKEDCVTPIVVRGKAKGELKLVPLDQAKVLGAEKPPAKVPKSKVEGLEIYKKVYHEVWRFRGEAKRSVTDRWLNYLKQDTFLDHLVIRRRESSCQNRL